MAFLAGLSLLLPFLPCVGGGFRTSWTPRLEWLAWPLAWLLEFVGLSRWLP